MGRHKKRAGTLISLKRDEHGLRACLVVTLNRTQDGHDAEVHGGLVLDSCPLYASEEPAQASDTPRLVCDMLDWLGVHYHVDWLRTAWQSGEWIRDGYVGSPLIPDW